jgi:hypothetical protein
MIHAPTQSQIYTALRYAGTAAGTVGTIAALAGVVDQQTSQSIVAAFQDVVKDLTQLLGDSSKLVLLVIPVATVWLGKIGYSSASPKSQIASVQAMPAAQVTVNDPKLAEGIPGVKVGPVPAPISVK